MPPADARATPRGVGVALSDRGDGDLAIRAQAGSLPAFAELIRRWESRLFNFVLRRSSAMALSHTDAEDITQESFVRAWEHIGRFRPSKGTRFSTWLFTIASRLTVDHARGRGLARKHQESLAMSRTQGDDGHPCGDSTAREPDGAALWALASRLLSDDQHAVLWLRYAEDLSMAEIARVLGRTQIGVRVMLHRARSSLLRAVNNPAGSTGRRDDKP